MLNAKKIITGDNSYKDQLGLIESRHIHLFTRRNGIGKEGLDHIRNKVGEVVSGVSNDRLFGFVEEYDWQIVNEPHAIELFEKGVKGNQAVVVSPTVKDKDIFITCPTGLLLKGVNQKNGEEYIAEPVFCKCPYSTGLFAQIKAMETANEVKESLPKYYWRLLDQMVACGAAVGHLFTYHPMMPEGKQSHSIEFSSILQAADIRFLKQRKEAIEVLYLIALSELRK